MASSHVSSRVTKPHRTYILHISHRSIMHLRPLFTLAAALLLLTAYHEMLFSEDEATRLKAAKSWADWESYLIQFEPKDVDGWDMANFVDVCQDGFIAL